MSISKAPRAVMSDHESTGCAWKNVNAAMKDNKSRPPERATPVRALLSFCKLQSFVTLTSHAARIVMLPVIAGRQKATNLAVLGLRGPELRELTIESQ